MKKNQEGDNGPEISDEDFLNAIPGAAPAAETLEGGSGETGEAAPRKRGRPPGSANKTSSAPIVDLFPADDTPKKKAGRPASKGERNLEPIVETVVAAHSATLLLTGTTIFLVDEDEARRLVTAAANLMEEYGIKFKGKSGAAIAFAGVALMIYAPRAVNYALFLRQQKAAPAKEHAA